MRWMTGLLALVCATPALSTELLVNGDFETGNYTGWTTSTLAGSNGTLSIDAPGTTTPSSGNATAANALGGSFYSVTDQSGPGTYALLQSFLVPVGTTNLTFSFQMFANDWSGLTTVNPAGLDHNAVPNQHARVDLLIAGASAFSTAPGDIVANFFLGADPFATNPNPYTSYNFNIFGLVTPGQTYQVRFAEVDNQFFFNQGVDNVSVFATDSAVPEPATWAMMLLGFGAIGLSLRSAKRRRFRTSPGCQQAALS